MAALERFNSVMMKVTWVVLAVGLVNHFVFEFMPRHWEARLIDAIWVLVGLTIAGQVAHWLARRFRAAPPGSGAEPTD